MTLLTQAGSCISSSIICTEGYADSGAVQTCELQFPCLPPSLVPTMSYARKCVLAAGGPFGMHVCVRARILSV
jgi:hypothetical protein